MSESPISPGIVVRHARRPAFDTVCWLNVSSALAHLREPAPSWPPGTMTKLMPFKIRTDADYLAWCREGRP